MKHMKKILYSMMVVLCLMFTAAGTTAVLADTPSTEKPAPVPREGFEEQTAYLIKGQKTRLKTIGLQGPLRWTSSKKKVATVSKSGVITAKKRGKTVITVYAGNEPYTCVLNVETPEICKTKASMLTGTTLQLWMRKTAQRPKFVWKTSNPKRATVSANGLVTAHKKGKVTITAQLGKKKYKCKVSVDNPKLSKTSLTIKAGETETLKVKGTTLKTKWSSSDTSVATVKKGKVTAKHIGTATIEAKVGNKNGYKILKCTVTVKDNPITSVKISESSITLSAGDDKKLQATVYPSTTTHSKKITWSSSDTSVAKVSSDGRVTAVKVGTATIKAEAGGKSDTCKVTVKPSMSMKYQEIKNYIQRHGRTNTEGNLAVSSTNGSATASLEINRGTGQLMFGYAYNGSYNTVRISMIFDVPRNSNVSPTLRFVSSNKKTEYQAAVTVSASSIQRGMKLSWKLLDSTTKVQEGAIQTTCNSKFNEALSGWQSILKSCTGYDLSDIGFSSYR